MDRQILSEINRFREIMGLSVISEAATPGTGILDLIFGAAGKTGDEFAEALGKNIDDISDPFMRDVVEKMKSSIDDNIGEFGGKNADEVLDDISAIAKGELRPLAGLDKLLSRVESEILNNPSLSEKYLDNFLDTYPSVKNFVNDTDRNSLLKSLKDEFPDQFDTEYNKLIDNVNDELDTLGVSQSVRDKIINKIDTNIGKSIPSNIGDEGDLIDDVIDSLGDESEEIDISSEISDFLNKSEVYKGWENLTSDQLNAFKLQEFKKLKDEIFNSGGGLTETQQAKVLWFANQGYITKDLYNKLLSIKSPSFAVLDNAWAAYKQLKNTAGPNSKIPGFSEYFEKNWSSEYSKYQNWKLWGVKTKQWVLRNFFKIKNGQGKIDLSTIGGTLLNWVLLSLIPTLGAGLVYYKQGTGFANREGKILLLNNKEDRDKWFNEFFRDTSEEFNVHTSDGKVEELPLNSDTRNEGYSKTPPTIKTVLGFTESGAAVLETETPVYFMGLEYKYFVLDISTLSQGLSDKLGDFNADLDAYLTNPLLSQSATTSGKYKDDLESFKKWYVSRGSQYETADMSKAGKDDKGWYLGPTATKRYTLNSDSTGFDKKDIDKKDIEKK